MLVVVVVVVVATAMTAACKIFLLHGTKGSGDGLMYWVWKVPLLLERNDESDVQFVPVVVICDDVTTVLDGSFPFELLNISSCAPVELSFLLPTADQKGFLVLPRGSIIPSLFSSPTNPNLSILPVFVLPVLVVRRNSGTLITPCSLLDLPSPQRNNFRTDWRLVDFRSVFHFGFGLAAAVSHR